MKILLVGEYSNVHATLARGLRTLGHEVVVASNGDFWKNYPRDIDLKREFGLRGAQSFFWRLARALVRMRGFDVVQLVNPMFLELKAERLRPIYRYLRRHNKRIVLGAFGMDYYWAQVNTEIRPMRYSDFNLGDSIRQDEEARLHRQEWIGTAKGDLCREIAHDCDGIVACLYEYEVTYRQVEALAQKTCYIPLPIDVDDIDCLPKSPGEQDRMSEEPIRLFVGISRGRSAYKGTDVMLRAARRVEAAYPGRLEIRVAEGLPYEEYRRMLAGSDVMLDQLYSYTPSMNSLLAMSQGIIVVGGGEEEAYEYLHEAALRPVVNVQPSEQSVYDALESLVLDPERLLSLKQQSVAFVRKYHAHSKVAKQYEVFYKRLCIS